MIREFNYTQRKRIESKHIQIQYIEPNNGDFHSFDVELNLEELQLPSDAPLLVEASRGNSVMRFPWGTAGQPAAPENRELTDVPPVPNFRVMALAVDDSRRILALADQIKPRWERGQAPGASPLIEPFEEDLGQEVWKLDLGEEGELPVLLVNSRIDGISGIVKQDPVFRSLVFPEILRAVLTKALIIEETDPEDEDGYWYGWMSFVRQFYSEEYLSTSDEGANKEALQKWIDGAVADFTSTRFNARDIYAGR